MSETKKDNGFTRWSKKHAELWKFIKFSIAGGSSSAVELIVHMVLLNTAFKGLTSVPVVNDALNMIGITSKGYLYTYLISTTNGWIGSAMTTFAQSHDLTGNLWDLVIKLIGMTIPTLWTYPCNRFIIHRRKKSTIEAEMAAESLSAVEEA